MVPAVMVPAVSPQLQGAFVAIAYIACTQEIDFDKDTEFLPSHLAKAVDAGRTTTAAMRRACGFKGRAAKLSCAAALLRRNMFETSNVCPTSLSF